MAGRELEWEDGRAALQASLPENVQAALESLPKPCRLQVLRHLQIIMDPRQADQHTFRSGMYMGAVSYAFCREDIDAAGYHALSDFHEALTAPPA